MIARIVRQCLVAPGLFVFLTVAGCGGGPALRAAEQGDLAGIRRSLGSDAAVSAIDGDEARDIARAVLHRDLDKVKGDDAVKKLREVSSCAGGLSSELEARSGNRDEVGVVASLLRFEAGTLDHEDLGDLARSMLKMPEASKLWRAVEARSLSGPNDGAQRRGLFLDGDQAVRLSAIEASRDAVDPSDLEGLLEAARLDPYPAARTAAIMAAGNLGGERVVIALGDMFVQASEDERLAIIGAWASPRGIFAGGRDKLVRVIEAEQGPEQIAAAGVLVRRPGPGVEQATHVLSRAVETGSTRERVFAIRAALLELEAVRKAVVKAAEDPDLDVALAALERSLELYPASGEGAKPKERAAVVAKLMVLAKEPGIRALMARAALARGGAREVMPLLQTDAKSTEAQARKAAGMSFVSMGEFGRAAMIAADEDERVRTGVACALLRATK